MRCSNSVKVDRCDFFEETCMAQNTKNVVEKLVDGQRMLNRTQSYIEQLNHPDCIQ